MKMWGLLLCSSTALAWTLPATAQEAAQPGAEAQDAATNDGNDIIVMARKRSERLIDIPETITALSADAIEKGGITSVNAIQQQTPNLLVNQRGDNEPNVVIRGVGAFGNTQGVGFYIDDVQNFTDQTMPVEDVERIEILKGPQGTLYGGSNVGGAVKYYLKRPGEESGGEAKIEYGSFDTFRSFLAYDARLADAFGVRISGYYNRSDGFISDSLRETHLDRSEDWGVRVAADWTPSDRFDAQLTYRHNDSDSGGNIYIIADEASDYSRQSAYSFDPRLRRNVDGGILALNYHASAFDISSITSYTHKSFTVHFDLDYSPADATSVEVGPDNRNATQVFTQELRAASSSGGDLEWLVGGYYSWVKNRAYTLNADLTLGPVASPTGSTLVIEDFLDNHTSEKQYAAFATLNYNLGKLKLGGGLRVARNEFVGRNDNFATVQSVKETTVLPKVTLGYQAGPDTLIYANYAIGSEPGRVNLLSAVSPASGDPYRSERANNFEVGIKGSSADRKLFYEFAGYYIDYSRRQFESTLFIDTNGDGLVDTPLEQILNIGKSVGYGIEGGVTYQPIRDLRLSLSGGYLHSEWSDRNANFRGTNLDGFVTPYSPRFTGNASVEYQAPLAASGLEINARAAVSYTSSYYNDPRKFTEQVEGSGVFFSTRQDGYALVNARLAVGNPDQGWEIAVRGENIFGEKYFTEFTPDALGRGTARIGQPATFLGSFSVKF